MTNLLMNSLVQPTLALTPGPMELVIVLAIFLLLFGSRLPGTMRSLGQSLVQFKKGMKDSDDESSSGSENLR